MEDYLRVKKKLKPKIMANQIWFMASQIVLCMAIMAINFPPLFIAL